VKARYVIQIKKEIKENKPSPLGDFCKGCNFEACWCWIEKDDEIIISKIKKIFYISRAYL